MESRVCLQPLRNLISEVPIHYKSAMYIRIAFHNGGSHSQKDELTVVVERMVYESEFCEGGCGEEMLRTGYTP